MIADTAFLLIIIALFSGLKIGVKADKILSCLVFLFIFVVLAIFFQHRNVLEEQVFATVWNSSPSGNIMLDIISNSANCEIILPYFVFTTLAIGYNFIFRYEERRSVYNSLLLFNLAALILIIAGNSLVQLLSGVFLIDILALLMIKDMGISQKYAMFNLIADMILFSVLAVVNGQIESLDIRQIAEYNKVGQHQDFVALSGLAVVFIKLGFIPFQLGILSLKNIRFHRLQSVLFLTSPMAAVVLLMKFGVLWQNSKYFSIFLPIECWLAILWGGICFLIRGNLKQKMVYLQMLFMGFLVLTLFKQHFEWSTELTNLLVGQYLMVSIFYYLYYYANRSVNLLKLPNYVFKSKFGLGFIYAVMAVVLFVMAHNVFKLNENDGLYIWCGGLFYALGSSLLLRQFSSVKAQNESEHFSQPIKLAYWGLLLSVIVNLWPQSFVWEWNIQNYFREIMVMIVFIGVAFLPTLPLIYRLYRNEKLQQSDFGEAAYKSLLVEPMDFSGRVLAVIIDRMLVEKWIVGFLSWCLQTAIRLFRNIHYNRFWGILLIFIMLVGLLAVSFYAGRSN